MPSLFQGTNLKLFTGHVIALRNVEIRLIALVLEVAFFSSVSLKERKDEICNVSDKKIKTKSFGLIIKTYETNDAFNK